MTQLVDHDPFAAELERTFAATEAQKEVWAATRLGDDASCAFNESVSLHLRGPLDVAALRQAAQRLIRHHEALRCTFSPADGRVCVAAHLPIEVPFDDLAPLPQAEREARRQAVLASEAETPFDLEYGPLLRFRLLRLGRDEHWLTVTAHHIVCDGWSMALLLRDLGSLYSGAAPAPAEPLSTYARHAAAQAAQPADRRAEEYWLRQFAGEVPALQLPPDRPRPAIKTYRARRHDYVLDPHLVQAVKRFGARHRASFFVTLLAAYVALLHRLTGQRDLVVGIPAAHQAAADMPNVVGHWVNVLPVRCRVEPEAAFAECLQHVRGQVLDAYEHQQVTFARLLQLLRLPRDPSRVPLVATVFNVDQEIQGKDLAFAGLAAEFHSNPRHFENAELSINAAERPDRVVLECQYNTDLFTAGTIRDRLVSFEVLLHSIVADSGRAIGRLPILSRAQQEHLLGQCNAVTRRYQRDRTLVEILDAQAQRTPDRASAVCGAEPIRYAELHARANRLAHHLQKLGAGRNMPVGLCVERSVDMLVGMVGILKAGAACLPLDPHQAREHQQLILADARLPIVVTQAPRLDLLPDTVRKVVCLDRDRAVLDAQRADAPDCRARPEDAASMIYTAGSTGRPNGVLVPHSAIAHLLLSIADHPGLGAADVLVALANVVADRSVLELLAPLTVGARVVIADRDTVADGRRLAQLLADSGATIVQGTPATWRMLLAAGWQGSPTLTIWTSGEELTPDLLRALLGRVRRVFNLYGPPETTCFCTAGELTDPERIHIGRPIAGTKIYILDEHREVVPIGVPGELYVGGAGVALGYLNRQEETAARFVENPYHDPIAGDRSGRLYRTGDLARWQHDGTLEYLGTIDQQTKP